MADMIEWMTSWGSMYSNHAMIRTLVAFAHIGALIVGGGLAVATDRSLLGAWRNDETARKRALGGLPATHRLVVAAFVLIVASGALLFASDYETFVASRLFWTKMSLVALLGLNGALLWRAEQRAASGDPGAWRTLRVTAAASVTLWLLTTFGGVALPNIG